MEAKFCKKKAKAIGEGLRTLGVCSSWWSFTAQLMPEFAHTGLCWAGHAAARTARATVGRGGFLGQPYLLDSGPRGMLGFTSGLLHSPGQALDLPRCLGQATLCVTPFVGLSACFLPGQIQAYVGRGSVPTLGSS